MQRGRSREGAWIEIQYALVDPRPYDRRSREGAWIEIFATICGCATADVAPVRERGLKLQWGNAGNSSGSSLP